MIGLLAAQILRAHGCRVVGIDLDGERCDLARALGADDAMGPAGAEARSCALEPRPGRRSRASSPRRPTGSEPAVLAAELARDKGRIVAVGATGLDLPRRTLYQKELSVVVSRSYGPGRYDPDYEERGRDYPRAYVRWTERENMRAFLDLRRRRPRRRAAARSRTGSTSSAARGLRDASRRASVARHPARLRGRARRGAGRVRRIRRVAVRARRRTGRRADQRDRRRQLRAERAAARVGGHEHVRLGDGRRRHGPVGAIGGRQVRFRVLLDVDATTSGRDGDCRRGRHRHAARQPRAARRSRRSKRARPCSSRSRCASPRPSWTASPTSWSAARGGAGAVRDGRLQPPLRAGRRGRPRRLAGAAGEHRLPRQRRPSSAAELDRATSTRAAAASSARCVTSSISARTWRARRSSRSAPRIRQRVQTT